MARKKNTKKRKVATYTHDKQERLNNPPVGLVTPDTDKDEPDKTYAYDPHLDPQLQWAGKAEHTSFNVPTVSLHVHERINPRSIIEAVKRRNGNGEQYSLFEDASENRPIREAIEFYKHKHNWTNRLIAGDSLLVMNSLLEKEGLGSQVQMVYIDPPYGIRYGSNFQPFVDKRNVSLGDSDDDLTQEPEMIRAFRDTWELNIHSYLTYLRDRLLLGRDLLHESGSCFVQIGDENVHLVRNLMDEVFGAENFRAIISVKKTAGLAAQGLASVTDYIVWYARDKEKMKSRTLFRKQNYQDDPNYVWIMSPEGEKRRLTSDESRSGEIPEGWKLFRHQIFLAAGRTPSCIYPLDYEGEEFLPTAGRSWSTNAEGAERLKLAGRLTKYGNSVSYVRFADDFPVIPFNNMWEDGASGVGMQKTYVVQTNVKLVQRCMLMVTDPGDLVIDPTCGSGTTAYVAEQWGRRWITCDTSRVAVTLAKQRLMTSNFEYYELAHPDEGIGSGLTYKRVQHLTLRSIANNPEIEKGMSPTAINECIRKHSNHETLYDDAVVSKSKARVTGPFTVEAVPAPAVKPLDEIDDRGDQSVNESVARTGETQRQADWRDELFKTGIKGKGGQKVQFSRVEPLAGTRWLHADAETKESAPQRSVVSFGPEHAPMEQRQVALAIEEAQQLVPKPKIIVFAAFQFDPEAAKDIDETNWPGVTLLKAQMNADLLTEDLKKKRASNESFWLIGQPDVEVDKVTSGEDEGKYRVSVHGFDYYNTKTGTIDSGTDDKIAMWMLDPDYDGRSLFPRQVFFPMSGAKDGWSKLARHLKAELDEELVESYRGTASLPFEGGEHKRAAVKIIDNRGIESLKIIGLD